MSNDSDDALFLYRRVDSSNDERGRHLVANCDLEKGRLVLAERPLVALPSLDNLRYHAICHGCWAFVGGPTATLHRRRPGRHRFLLMNDTHVGNGNDDDYTVIPCRDGCGHVYCSSECERDAWSAHHYCLCTGKYSERNDDGIEEAAPLVRFKRFCVETNEILLLVAQWWVAQHTTMARMIMTTTKKEELSRYTDFTMNSWWDILTAEQAKNRKQKKKEQQQQQQSGTGGDGDSVVEDDDAKADRQNQNLREMLEQMCTDAADLLNQVFAETAAEELCSSSSTTIRIPSITALDIAQRIGACEQNAMGIRQRSPLCRNVFDLLLNGPGDIDDRNENGDNKTTTSSLECRQALVQCLEEAGFFGGADEEDDENKNENEAPASPDENDAHDEPHHDHLNDDQHDAHDEGSHDHHHYDCGSSKSEQSNEKLTETEDGDEIGETWNYSSVEIAQFITTLRIDEDGSVRDLAIPHHVSGSSDKDDDDDDAGVTVGDDLDLVFPPLDGTAMFSTTCKMNHSCDPNIMVVYRRLPGWGRHFPLTAFSVATRDIAVGEELTISYIDANESYEERTKSLSSYGFTCRCQRCVQEGGKMDNNNNNDIDGEDCPIGRRQEPDEHVDDCNHPEKPNVANAIELFDSESIEEDDGGACPEDQQDDRSQDGLAKLQQILSRLDTTANHSRFGLIPQKAFSSVAAFVLVTAKEVCRAVTTTAAAATATTKAAAAVVAKRWVGLLDQCVSALQLRDYCMAKIVGNDLESSIASAMATHGGFSNTCERELYWCAALTAAIGLAYDYNFIEAQVLCDKAFTLGLRSPANGYSHFFRYVEKFSLQMSQGPYSYFSVSDCWRRNEMEMAENPEQTNSSIPEISGSMSSIDFDKFLGNAEPAVFRKMALHWPAVQKWSSLSYICAIGGHHLVPIELGSMLGGSMKETFMTLRQFIEEYLIPSNQHGYWSLKDSLRRAIHVAYMAQHPLMDHITALRSDVTLLDNLSASPKETMLWVGTGGTRTPLHFDSYDNLFVQVVGYKYVRLYAPDQTPKLYVVSGSDSTSFSKQGNMSALDCEREDLAKHPMAADAVFTDVLLGPGDCLFIPARSWHYVRSCTTSISLNFWI